jgi:hypothetical protein
VAGLISGVEVPGSATTLLVNVIGTRNVTIQCLLNVLTYKQRDVL